MAGNEVMIAPVQTEAMGLGLGGLEGAQRSERETALWVANMGSPDQIINRVKDQADARGIDMVSNDGPAFGASITYRDSIVGQQFRLNANPAFRVLATTSGIRAFDQEWADEYALAMEERFELIGESENCWLDAARVQTFTGLIHLGVLSSFMMGEILATAEWLNQDRRRPLSTAIQMVSPARLCNPNGVQDDRYLRRGVKKDRRGRPVGYHFRKAHPTENYDSDSWQWTYVPAEKPWGRRQVIHIIQQRRADQSRGVAAIVAVLKKMRMGKTASELLLQNLVINASYAAAIESELPSEMVAAMMGQGTGPENYQAAITAVMQMIAAYVGGSNNIMIDGVKIPHLLPGTKLQTKTLGAPGGAGDRFEQSVQRHIAAGLGMSYEEFSKDFNGVSYSGLKGAFGSTEKHMKVEKKITADRFANQIYQLVAEEEIAEGRVPLPRRADRDLFYVPLMKEAFCRAKWIGAGKGQIDELKETQAALLRIKGGISTYQQECARFGDDYREVFRQKAREQGLADELELVFTTDAQAGTAGASTQGNLADENANAGGGE